MTLHLLQNMLTLVSKNGTETRMQRLSWTREKRHQLILVGTMTMTKVLSTNTE